MVGACSPKKRLYPAHPAKEKENRSLLQNLQNGAPSGCRPLALILGPSIHEKAEM
jgi:hypothetical protein